MTGLGLLEATPQANIPAQEDQADANGNGIAGRASWAPDDRGKPALGQRWV